MIALGIVIVIVSGIVASVGLCCYFSYKPTQLEYQKEIDKKASEISAKALILQIEKENTRQMEIDADAFKEKEKRMQYEIKSAYRDKHCTSLY